MSLPSRFLAASLATLLFLFAALPSRAAIETLPAGTYIIPMDNQLQGNFNLRSYGLAVRLLHAGVPLKWVINPTKGKDGIDFTAPASRIRPTAQGSASRNFIAGPLAVHPGFEAQALAVINSFGNNVAVFQLSAAATVNVDSTLLHKPKVAVFNQGGKADIHTDILSDAGLINGTHYQKVTNANSIGPASCFTVATEPHSDNVSAAAANGLLSFVRSGGNFLGQCAAVRSYTQRGVLAGYQTDGDLGGSMRFDNFSDPMAQFQGGLDDEGGSVKSFKLTSNPGKRIAYSSSDGSRYKAYVGKVTGVTTINGGWVHYLAGHEYEGGINGINGKRMLLNAVLRASDRPSECGLSLASDIAVTKTVNNSTPNVGGNVTFTITAINNGPLNTTGAVVNDLLPSGLTYVSHSASAGTYVPGTGVWTIGALSSGASRTLTITATATAAAIPSRTNTATITSNNPDSNPNNNTASATVTPRYADMRVLKTVDNSTQTVGQNVTFTVTASNLGPFATTGATVNDLLPAGLIYVSHTASAGIYTPGSGVWSIGSMNSGASQALTLTATVTAAGLPSVTNTASVTSNLFDPNTGNNTATSTVTPIVSDLRVVKTVDNGSQDVGGNVVFSIVVTNLGPSNNTGVTLNDLLPSGLNYVSHTTSIGTYNPGSGVWFIGNLNNGVSRTLTVTATVTAAAAPSVVNTATVTGNVYDPNPGNNTSSVSVSPNLAADLQVVKTVDDSAPLLNTDVVFTIVASNNGPLNATGVVVSDLLHPGLTYVSHTVSTGTYTPGTGAWAIGNLAVSATQTLTITATVNSLSVPQVTNTASISGEQFDPNPNNNTSSVDVIPDVVTDLSIVKTVDEANPVLGENVIYTIVATNNGPSDATGVVVNDLLPMGLDYVTHSASAGIYVPASGVWTIGNLANGASRTLTVTATTTLAGGSSVVNTATIDGNEPDPDPNNNEDDEEINILSGADVSIVKTVDESMPFIGDVVTFTVTASNAGPETATNVLVSDTFPAGFANPTNISGGGVLNGNTITWPAQTILNGESVAFTFQLTVVNP